MGKIQVCKRCIMDSRSDEYIRFDEQGYCSYCNKALADMPSIYYPNEVGAQKLTNMIKRLKKENADKQYDCLMGISGGLDSSYLAYLGAVKWGLRILAVHVDDGFDTEVAAQNIQKLCDTAKIELVVIKPDPRQFNELTRAFLLARVPNLAMPQDNVLFACLYKFAKEKGIRTFLSGGNFALECILQQGNTHDAYDVKNIRDINSRYGREKLDKLPLISLLKKDIYTYILNIETLRPLDYIDYNRDRALRELHEFCGFEYYGRKHLENTLTKFVQLYWFPHKFNVDKRTSHYSSMIVSGQLTREKALELMEEPLYDETEMQKEIDFILEKLDLSWNDLERVMKESPRQHTDYRTSPYAVAKRQLIKTLRLFIKRQKKQD